VGELYLADTDDQAGAEECFRTAIETARRQQSRAWELRATTSLARLWQRQGRGEEAGDALAAVYGTYTEGFTTLDLVAANVRLEGLATPPGQHRDALCRTQQRLRKRVEQSTLQRGAFLVAQELVESRYPACLASFGVGLRFTIHARLAAAPRS
jgi:hypothetical protein